MAGNLKGHQGLISINVKALSFSNTNRSYTGLE